MTTRLIDVGANNYLLPLKDEEYELTWSQQVWLSSMFRLEHAPIFHSLNRKAWWFDYFLDMEYRDLLKIWKGLGFRSKHRKTKDAYAADLCMYFYNLIQSFINSSPSPTHRTGS